MRAACTEEKTRRQREKKEAEEKVGARQGKHKKREEKSKIFDRETRPQCVCGGAEVAVLPRSLPHPVVLGVNRVSREDS